MGPTNGITLAEDWKVTLSLSVKNRLLANPDRYADDAVLKTWTAMFKKFA